MSNRKVGKQTYRQAVIYVNIQAVIQRFIQASRKTSSHISVHPIILANIHSYMQANRQLCTNIQSRSQTDTGRQSYIHIQVGKQACIQTSSHTGKQTYRQANRHTGRQSQVHAGIQAVI